MKALRQYSFSALLISLCMILAAFMAQKLNEYRLTVNTVHEQKIATAIPSMLNHWQQLDFVNIKSVITAGPYSQLVERIYQNTQGYQIMLSVAYGSKQIGDDIQAHRPEYCYRAQGFSVTPSQDRKLDYQNSQLAVRDFQAIRQNRTESITYLLTIGNEIVLPGFSRKFAQIKQSLSGGIPDGMVIRVSSVNIPPEKVMTMHNEFLTSLFPHLNIGQPPKELL